MSTLKSAERETVDPDSMDDSFEKILAILGDGVGVSRRTGATTSRGMSGVDEGSDSSGCCSKRAMDITHTRNRVQDRLPPLPSSHPGTIFTTPNPRGGLRSSRVPLSPPPDSPDPSSAPEIMKSGGIRSEVGSEGRRKEKIKDLVEVGLETPPEDPLDTVVAPEGENLPSGVFAKPQGSQDKLSIDGLGKGDLARLELVTSDGDAAYNVARTPRPRARQTSATLLYALQSRSSPPSHPAQEHSHRSTHSYSLGSPPLRQANPIKLNGAKHRSRAPTYDVLYGDPTPLDVLNRSFPVIDPSSVTSPDLGSRKWESDLSAQAGEGNPQEARGWKRTVPAFEGYRDKLTADEKARMLPQADDPKWHNLDLETVNRQLQKGLVEAGDDLPRRGDEGRADYGRSKGFRLIPTEGLATVQERLDGMVEKMGGLREEMIALRRALTTPVPHSELELPSETTERRSEPINSDAKLCGGFFLNLAACQDLVMSIDRKVTGHNRAEEVVFSGSNLAMLRELMEKGDMGDQVESC